MRNPTVDWAVDPETELAPSFGVAWSHTHFQLVGGYPEARAARRQLIAEGKGAGLLRRTFIFVNNWLDGNAISTIAAILELV